MSQVVHPSSLRNNQSSSLMAVFATLFVGLFAFAVLVAGYAALLTRVMPQGNAAAAHVIVPQRHVQLHLDIVINQPGMQQDWPAYAPNTLTVPANSLVTITLRNYDLGDTPLPANSPFGNVRGTIGNVANMDGHSYASLALEKVAHTFTVPQLGINVPIPGDAPQGAAYASVTFTFHTGKAGTYLFQCFDPCGTGSSGWMGPMMTKGYMVGTLIVQ